MLLAEGVEGFFLQDKHLAFGFADYSGVAQVILQECRFAETGLLVSRQNGDGKGVARGGRLDDFDLAS